MSENSADIGINQSWGQIGEINLRPVLMLAVFFAFFTNLAYPLHFPLTQMMFDYSEGFQRRGLVGTILYFLTGDALTLSEAYWGAFLITMTGATALVVFLWRRLRGDFAGDLLLLLFLSSFAFAGFLGNGGYLDGLLLALVVIGLVALERWHFGYWVALICFLIAILIHENALPYFGVLLAFAAVLQGGGTLTSKMRAAGFLGAGAVLVLVLFTQFLLPPDAGQRLAETLTSRAEFWLDDEALAIATRGFSDNHSYFEDIRNSTSYFIWLTFDGGLCLIMSGVLIRLNLHLLSQTGWTTRAVMVLAIIAPYSLNLIAFDVMRFGVMSVLVGFLCSAIILGKDASRRTILRQYLTLPVVLLLLVFNLQAALMPLNATNRHWNGVPYAAIHLVKLFAPVTEAE